MKSLSGESNGCEMVKPRPLNSIHIFSQTRDGAGLAQEGISNKTRDVIAKLGAFPMGA